MRLPPVQHRSSSREHSTRRGFTLAEVILSTVVLGLIAMALGSVLRLALRVAPSSSDQIIQARDVDRALDRCYRDLSAATAITSNTVQSIVFTVADRTGDGVAEEIKYAWSGLAGDPLVMSLNGVSSNLISAVDQFQVTPRTRSESITSGSTSVLGSEALLCAYQTVGDSLSTLTASQNVGQVFSPRLPANATAWTVTRVRFHARSGLKTGTFAVQLWGTSNDLPVTPALASVTLNSTDLPLTAGWVAATPANIPTFTPGQSIALVLRCMTSGLGTMANVTYQQNGVADRYAQFATSDKNGVWTGQNEGSMTFEVYGKVTLNVPTSASITRTTAIELAVRPTGSASTVTTTITLVGIPQ